MSDKRTGMKPKQAKAPSAPVVELPEKNTGGRKR